MRTVRLIGHESAAVERRDRADAIGHRGCRAERKRPAHAVPLRADLAVLRHRLLHIEPADERLGVGERRRLVQRLRERHQLGNRRGRSLRGGRRLHPAIERIDHDYGVAGFGEALAHLAEGRPQAEDVGPYEHARRGAVCRVHEVGVAGAIRRLDGDVGFGESIVW